MELELQHAASIPIPAEPEAQSDKTNQLQTEHVSNGHHTRQEEANKSGRDFRSITVEEDNL